MQLQTCIRTVFQDLGRSLKSPVTDDISFSEISESSFVAVGNSYCFFTFLSIQNPSVEKQKKSISFHFGGGGGVHSSKLVVKGCVFTFHRRTEEPVQEIQEPHIFSGPDFFSSGSSSERLKTCGFFRLRLLSPELTEIPGGNIAYLCVFVSGYHLFKTEEES